MAFPPTNRQCTLASTSYLLNELPASLMKGTGVAISGVATSDFGLLYRDRSVPRTAHSLAIDTLRAALADCGLDKKDIDGIICVRLPAYQHVATEIGLPNLRLAYSLEGTGRMAAVAIQQAAAAIQTGQGQAIAVMYGNDGRSVGDRYGGRFDANSPGAYDAMYGMTSPGAYVAMMYRRYQHEFNAGSDGLAAVAINNRQNAALNDCAVMRTAIDFVDYYKSPFVAEPLRLLDYCLINDGGVCIIVTSTAMASRLKQPVVHIRAAASVGNFTAHYTSRDYFYAACGEAARIVYSDAGIGPGDVNCAQIYDNFTPTVLFSLEGFGFCNRGEAGHWVQGGRIARDGALPLNTSGGHTSEGYMQGFALLAESVRQLRGQAGSRQVAKCEVVQYICVSPIVSSVIFSQ